MSSGPSSSWIVPFSLGIATTLVVSWTCSQASKRSQHQSNSKQSSSIATSPSASPTPEIKDGEELMDKPDLEQRMLRKAEAVIQWRTTRLVLVIERCTNDHNYSAILRTAEALGIQHVYMIDPPEIDDEGFESQAKKTQQQQITRTPQEIEARRLHHLFARNAQEWLDVKDYATAEDCVAELRKQGYQLWVTDLSQEAVSLGMDSPLMPKKVALVMGTDQADLRVYLPLRGFADSLNLSVATALILHQLFVMDPTLVGGITEEEKLELREEWYTKLCQQRLLTASQKKLRLKLQTKLKKCQALLDGSKQSGRPLDAREQERIGQMEKHRKQLGEIEALLDPAKVKAAIQEWVNNPPKPLTDVRRADSHRICYVGKNTRKFHEDHWKDMVATSDASTIPGATANEFRNQLPANPGQQRIDFEIEEKKI
eukprot:scaffold523_cov101-Cylindrotheca_fusiformis.AAC.11